MIREIHCWSAQLCPGGMRRELEAGGVVDLTGLHEDHLVNKAARCTLLKGLEPGLILAVSKHSPHKFCECHLLRLKHLREMRMMLSILTSCFLTRQMLLHSE